MFSPEHLNFPFPVLTTSCHQFVQAILAFSVTKLSGMKMVQRNRRLESELQEHEPLDDTFSLSSEESSSPQQLPPPSARHFSWLQYLKRVGPCAIASASDIGMGNISFRLVTLTFYTMVKSSSLGFVLLFGILFKLEVATIKLFCIISIMTVGVIMMVAGEAHFVLGGFLLVLGAAMFSGLRWSLTQLLLRSKDHVFNTHNNPIQTIMLLAPLMGIFLLSMGLIIEGPMGVIRSSLWHERGIPGGILLIIFPGVMAFLMTLSEFVLLNRTSVLTLSIVGIFKELVTILAASLIYGDRMTVVNSIGLVVTLAAIVAYNWYRYTMFASGE